MAKVEKEPVVTQAVAELRLRQHLDPRSIEAMTVDEGPARPPARNARRYIPALQQNVVTRPELNGAEVHTKVLGRLTIIRIAKMKAVRGRKSRQEPGHEPVQESDEQRNQNSEDPFHDLARPRFIGQTLSPLLATGWS